MKIKNDEDFGAILVCAVRYALGRRTYMPSIVAAFVKSVAGELSVRTLTTIRNDICTARDRGLLGDANIDVPVWLDLLNEVDFYLSGGVRGASDDNLGGRIRARRKELGIPQKRFADLCGVCNTYICEIECGKRKPSDGLVARIAYVLGVSVEYLVQGENA